MKKLVKRLFFRLPSSSILMFHHIGVDEKKKISSCVLSYDLFYEICNKYYMICSTVESTLHTNNRISFTFDDAFEDFYYNAFPVLKKFNIPFVLFVIEDFIGCEGYLSVEQLKEISESPLCEIGSHGKTHQLLSQLPDDELVLEIKQTKCRLADLLGVKIEKFAYSHGNADKRCLNMVRVYKNAFFADSLPLNFLTRLNRFKYPRLNITDATLEKFVNLLNRYLDNAATKCFG